MPGGADWCVPSYLFFWMLETLERFQCSRQEGWAEVGFVSRVSREFVKKCQTSFAVKLLDDPTPASRNFTSMRSLPARTSKRKHHSVQ
jgi:hypothetical protein